MNNTCLVCGSSMNEYLYGNTLIKCSSCGFITANLEIDPQMLRELYSGNYFKGEEYADYVSDKYIIVENFRRRIRMIKKMFPSQKINEILEIGCAYGFFGEEVLKQFPAARYTGFDISEDACGYATEILHLNARCEDFLDAEITGTFSDIFFWDSIEHLSQPHRFIEKASALLKPEGRIYITTGDIGAFVPKVMKSKWRLIHPPTHLHYFNRESISRLLEKYNLRVKRISYPGTTRSIRQIFYSLFLLQKERSRIAKYIYDNIPERWQVTINTRDIMFVIAEKK